MKRKILTQSVSVSGPDFWGRESAVTFHPYYSPGWWLKTPTLENPDKVIPITHRIAQYHMGQIQLVSDGYVLGVYEHIGILRFLGIDSVLIELGKPRMWAPYLGGAGAYYDRLKDYLSSTETTVPWFDPSDSFTYKYLGKRKGSVSIYKSAESLSLKLSITAGWNPLPTVQGEIIINNDTDELEWSKILYAKPQGYPWSRQIVAKCMSLFGWPNYNYVAWRSDFKTMEDTADAFFYHRAQDILGALSLVDYRLLPQCSLESYFAGHEGDLKAINGSFIS